MSNRRQNNRSSMERIRTWLVSPDGFAAAAAGGGEPAPLLALEAYRRSLTPELAAALRSNDPPAARPAIGEAVAEAA
jgi:hypothetical protein